MDVIGPIEPSTSNGHRFILVVIDYFTKWVEAIFHKSVIKKVVDGFVQNHIIYRLRIVECIITENRANLNSYLIKTTCEKFKIKHKISTTYRPQTNGAIEIADKNIKRILQKIINNDRHCHEKLPFALLGYRTIIRTTISATSFFLVYGSEVVIPDEL